MCFSLTDLNMNFHLVWPWLGQSWPLVPLIWSCRNIFLFLCIIYLFLFNLTPTSTTHFSPLFINFIPFFFFFFFLFLLFSNTSLIPIYYLYECLFSSLLLLSSLQVLITQHTSRREETSCSWPLASPVWLWVLVLFWWVCCTCLSVLTRNK